VSAEVAARFARFPAVGDDAGGVSLRMLRPTGRVHGDTHLAALAAGLWDVRQTARTLAALRASPSPESAHVLAWCERQWRAP
jgi:hypothetical protein